MTDLAKLVVRLEAEIGKYSENLDKATRQLSKFERSSNKLLGKAAAGFAAFFTIDRLESWGSHILENADQMGKFSQASGIAVDKFSKLQYAFETNNVEGEAFAMMMRQLNKNISEAAGSANSDGARAFRALGIEVKDARGQIRATDDVLSDIADRFQGYADGANKSALASELLGAKLGDRAIPALNGGSEGLKALGDEAERVGRVISEDLAQKADEFNDRMDRLKTTLVDGIGNRIAAELLPTLNELGQQFEDTAGGIDTFDHVARVAATGIKLLIDAGLSVGHVFDELGQQLGAAGAAIVQVLQGNFSAAASIIEERNADAIASTAELQKRLAILWGEGGDEILQEIKVTAKKIKMEAPNLAGGKELEEATKKAITTLKDMASKFDEQVATFGLTDAAVTKYRLTLGDLSDEVKRAGSAGDTLSESIIRQAEALEKLKVAKEVKDALAEVNAEILQLKGNSAEAEIAEFDRKNAELVKKLRQQGNEEGMRQIETLIKLKVAQADFNDAVQKAADIEADLGRQEDRIRNNREAGAISELTMQEEIGAARKKAAEDLRAVYDEQAKIAEQTGNPQMVEQVKQLGGEIENLKAQSDLLGKSVREGLEDNLSQSFKMLVKDIHSAGDAFESFINGVADQLLDLATKQLTQQILGSFSTAGGGGSQGNWFSTIAGLFAGGRASGGDVQEGMAYRVNENTPNSEWFVPGQSGQVVPAGKMGAVTVHQNFILQAPKGTVTRQTQLQVGAEAGRGLQTAMRRNN